MYWTFYGNYKGFLTSCLARGCYERELSLARERDDGLRLTRTALNFRASAVLTTRSLDVFAIAPFPFRHVCSDIEYKYNSWLF